MSYSRFFFSTMVNGSDPNTETIPTCKLLFCGGGSWRGGWTSTDQAIESDECVNSGWNFEWTMAKPWQSSEAKTLEAASSQGGIS